MKTTLEIAGSKRRSLLQRLAKMNKKAAATGSDFHAEITAEFMKPIKVAVKNDFGHTIGEATEMHEYLRVTITGTERPGFSGWEAVAVLTHTGGATLVSKCQEYVGDDDRGNPIFEDVITRDELPTDLTARCDHCGKKRTRGVTVIVRHNETDQLKQVGKSCLGNFFETDAISYLENTWITDLTAMQADEDDPDAPGRSYGLDRAQVAPSLVEFLDHCARAIRLDCYTSKGEAQRLKDEYEYLIRMKRFADARDVNVKPSTVNVALASLNALKVPETAEANTPTDADRAATQAALAWIETVDPGNSDYLYNLKESCALDHVMKRTAGFAASLFKAHTRALEKAAEKAAQNKALAEARAELVEIVEGRRTMTATVLSVKEYEGWRGELVDKMVVLTDDNQKVFGTVPGSLDTIAGDVIEFTATVERSRKDAKFGYFKRPTKARVVKEAKTDNK